jgi:dual-specificity kinase
VECWDREEQKYVAIKIIRAIEKYRDAAMIEIDILEALKKNDPNSEHPCIRLLSWFDFENHVR